MKKYVAGTIAALALAGGATVYALHRGTSSPPHGRPLAELRATFSDRTLPVATRVEALHGATASAGDANVAWLGEVATKDAELGAQAASALGEISDPAAAPALAKLAFDASASTLARSGALRGLAKTGVRDHAPELAALAADRAQPVRVRQEAALALKQLGSPAEVVVLSRALADDDEQVRISAEQALAAIGGADAKAQLAARRAQHPTQTEQVFLDRALSAP